MAELDPELRDKIIQTHTMMTVVVKNHDEHKKVVNSRLREQKKDLEEHKKSVSNRFAMQRKEIEAGKAFRVRVVTYASVAAGAITFFSEPVINGIKKLIGA